MHCLLSSHSNSQVPLGPECSRQSWHCHCNGCERLKSQSVQELVATGVKGGHANNKSFPDLTVKPPKLGYLSWQLLPWLLVLCNRLSKMMALISQGTLAHH